MKIRFTKMQGLGNDFVVIDAIHQAFAMSPERARALADRRFGVGCDQILIVERSADASVDFRYRIFNIDGEVEQCGNGARCFARFVRDKGLSSKDQIRVETLAGIISPRINRDGSVTVDMGVPVLEPARIPFVADNDAPSQALEVGDLNVMIGAVSMGNPHATLVVDNVDTAAVLTLGPAIEHHPRFPARVNAGFMQIVSPQHIRLRVFERAAGETLACGTGACAAVVTGMRRGLLLSPVRVSTRGGDMHIAWDGPGKPVLMSGPAVSVFDGEIELD